MPNALRNAAPWGPLEDQQSGETVEFLPPNKNNERITESLTAPSPYAIARAGSPLDYLDRCGGLCRSILRRRSLSASAAAAILAITILVLLSMCKALHNREQIPGVTRRMLSERGAKIDEDELSIVEGCLDLEQEMGILHQRASHIPEGDASSQIAELVSMLSDAAAAHEAVHGSTGAWGFISNEGNSPNEGQSHLSDQLLEGQGVSTAENDEFVPRALPVQPRGSTVLPTSLGRTVVTGVAPTVNIQPGEKEYTRSFLVDGGLLEVGEPSTSYAGSPEFLDSPDDSEDLRSHPYARVPALDAGVVPRDVNVNALFSRPRLGSSLYLCLNEIRRLLAQKTLNQNNADAFVHAVENLVSIVWFQAHKKQWNFRPSTVAEKYAIFFLAFDSLACAIQLLGESMKLPLWWNAFVEGFDTRLRLDSPPKRGSGGTCRRLAKRLAAALNVYKKGRRPPLAEVVALKRLIFCARDRPIMFKKPEWIPFQQDGGCH